MKTVIGQYWRSLTSFLWLTGFLLAAIAVGHAAVLYTRLTMLGSLGLVAVLSALVLLRTGLYRQLLIFLALLQIFTFAIKVGYGVVNTTLLALLPSAFVGLMILQVPLLINEGKLHFRWTLLDLAVVAFFLLDLLQVLNPYLDIFSDRRFLVVGLRGFQQRSFLGLIYFVARGLVRSERRFDTLARILAYSIALGGLYALIQQLFGFDLLESQHRMAVTSENLLAVAMYASRAVGFLGSPFTFGMMSAMGMLCSLYLLTSVSLSWRERFLATVSVFISGTAVLLSGSRSTYLSLILAVAVVVLWLPWARLFALLWRARRTITTGIVALAVFLAVFRDSSPVQYSMARVVTLGELSKLLSSQGKITDVNIAARRQLATRTWSLIVYNPFGYGTGIFNGGSNPEGVVKIKGFSTWTDNEFGSLALELGVQGVLLLLAIVALAVWRCRRLARIPGVRDRAIALLALVVICPAAGFGGQWLAAYPANILFWTFAGIIASLPLTASTSPVRAAAHADAGR